MNNWEESRSEEAERQARIDELTSNLNVDGVHNISKSKKGFQNGGSRLTSTDPNFFSSKNSDPN